MLRKWLEKRKKAKQLEVEKQKATHRQHIEIEKFYREVVGEPLPPNMFMYFFGSKRFMDHQKFVNELYRTRLLMKKYNYVLQN